MPIIVFVLQLVFRNAWTFLIALILLFGPSIAALVGGVASAIFARDDSDEQVIEQVVAMPTSTYYCTAQSGVIVRQSPSKTATQLGGLQYNEEVEVYEIENGYARIDYYGQEAWVSSQYITMSEGEAFLIENAKRKDVKILASGLQYEVVKKGKGKKPYAHSDILCTYTCSLPDGTVLDSATEPMEFNLGGVIKGFAEGVMQMKEGAHYILYIPANLGYGSKAVGNIPPHATVIYDVTLVEIVD